jgi:hypothetical protein
LPTERGISRTFIGIDTVKKGEKSFAKVGIREPQRVKLDPAKTIGGREVASTKRGKHVAHLN